MDTFLAVASRREVRRYADRPLEATAERRILDAGRVSGSSKNAQPWTFVIARSAAAREATARAVWAPENVLGAALVVGIVVRGKGPLMFDAGRAAQNMMLVAYNDGVGCCPNGIRDQAEMAAALGLEPDDQIANVLSFGYPARPGDPERLSAPEWLERADRKPFAEVVREV